MTLIAGRTCDLIVPGKPEPQGSKSAMLRGKKIEINGQRAILAPKVVIVEGSRHRRADGSYSDAPARRKAWREAVHLAAVAWRSKNGPPLDGPLAVEAWFYLPRPKKPKDPNFPIGPPDLDKLLRSIMDSMKGTAITDDSRVVDHFVHKRFAGPSGPHVRIHIQEV